MLRSEADKWLRGGAHPAPGVRLLCLPYAGGSATVFGAWKHLRSDIEVCSVQLPGRQERLSEPALVSLDTIVDRLVEALATRPGAPLALYGHSFGALVAFELALRLQRTGASPIALVVGARAAPHLKPAGAPIHALPHDAFVRAIHERYGTSLAILQNPGLLELALPPLRADVAVLENYVFPAGAKLDVPITALRGQLDPANDLARVQPWQEITTRPFQLESLQAGHFFVDTHRRWVQDHVLAAVDRALGDPMQAAASSTGSHAV